MNDLALQPLRLKFCISCIALLAFFTGSSQSGFSLQAKDSLNSRFYFVSAETEAGKDSIRHFYNAAIHFLRANSSCIQSSNTDEEVQKLNWQEVYYIKSAVNNSKKFKPGFMEKINYLKYSREMKDSNNLVLANKCFKMMNTDFITYREPGAGKKKGEAVHFSEVLRVDDNFYMHGYYRHNDISVELTFRLNGTFKIEFFMANRVIF